MNPFQELHHTIGYYVRALRLLWDASARYFILAFGFTVVMSIVPPTQILIFKIIIDRITAVIQTTSVADVDWVQLGWPIGIMVVVWAIGAICQPFSMELKMLLGIQARRHAEVLILQKASQMDLAFFETPEFYDKMDTALRHNTRVHNFALVALDFVGSLLSLFAISGLLWHIHPLMVLVLIVTTAPQAVINGYYANRHWNVMTSNAMGRRKASYVATLLSARDSIKEIQLFGLRRPLLERFQELWQKYINDEKQIRLSKEWVNAIGSVVSILGTASIWIYTIIEAVAARLTIGDVALAFQAAEQGRSTLSTVFRRGGVFYEDRLFAESMFHFLDLKPESIEGSLRSAPPSSNGHSPVPHPMQHGIEFRNVTFRYPGTEQYVLQDVSCTIRHGETVALVGENGAGKTTFVKLLSRFYDPTDGEILLDGRDLRDYELESLRTQIGIIFQDFVQYAFSARDNVGFGQIDRLHDDEHIHLALDRGGAQPVIDKLPDGLNTILGRTFNEGVDLSGGEWQKLALSRAFMRDAQLVILDEPTASLDAIAEYEIYNRFAELTAGKTTLFISHRFSTVRMAQHIIVLEGGRVIEEGSHEALVARDGQYATMFNLQAERYR